MAGDGSGGGSLALADLIDKYGEYIYFDLHHYCGGLNLVDLVRDGSGYSPRQILWLINGLPTESATKSEIQGGQHYRGWTVNSYLIANVADAVRENTWHRSAINTEKGKKTPEEPKPTYRPGDERVKKAAKKRNPFAARLAAAKAVKAAREQASG